MKQSSKTHQGVPGGEDGCVGGMRTDCLNAWDIWAVCARGLSNEEVQAAGVDGLAVDGSNAVDCSHLKEVRRRWMLRQLAVEAPGDLACVSVLEARSCKKHESKMRGHSMARTHE